MSKRPIRPTKQEKTCNIIKSVIGVKDESNLKLWEDFMKMNDSSKIAIDYVSTFENKVKEFISEVHQAQMKIAELA